jgi:hypothetical protein
MQVDQRQPGSSTNFDAFTLPSLTTSTLALGGVFTVAVGVVLASGIMEKALSAITK